MFEILYKVMVIKGSLEERKIAIETQAEGYFEIVWF